jgi:RNA 2',3'-cyclic 3'-phosphodiesterase
MRRLCGRGVVTSNPQSPVPRLFTALEVSDEARDRVLDLVERLRPAAANFKWEKRENLHITLKFLGDVASEQVDAVCRSVTEAAAGREPFEFELFGAGAFPDLKRPSILWLGVREGGDQIEKLFRAIQRGTTALGFPREDRKFSPHLTFGRLKRTARPPRELGELVKQYDDFSAGKSLAREVVLFESQLAPGGSIYRVLARVPLAGK